MVKTLKICHIIRILLFFFFFTICQNSSSVFFIFYLPYYAANSQRWSRQYPACHRHNSSQNCQMTVKCDQSEAEVCSVFLSYSFGPLTLALKWLLSNCVKYQKSGLKKEGKPVAWQTVHYNEKRKKKKRQNEHIKSDIFVCALSHKYPLWQRKNK